MATSYASGTGLESADALLKNFYLAPMQDQLNKSHPLLEFTEKSNRKFEGRKVVFPITIDRDQSVQAVGEGKAQPSAVSNVPAEASIASKLTQSVIQMTDEIIASAKTDKGAFADVTKQKMSDAIESLKNDINRQLYGDGLGYLGTMSTTTATVTSITVDTTRHFAKGQKLAIGTTTELAAGTAEATSVTSVDSATAITVASVAIVTGDKIVKGTAASNAYNNEMTGLAAIIPDTNADLQGVVVATYPDFKATVNRNGGTARSLSLDLMIQVADDIKNASGKDPDMMLMHTSVRREYAALLLADVRYAASNVETKLPGGFVKLQFAAGGSLTDIYVDRMCTYGTIFYLNTKDINQFVKEDWGWRQLDGSILQRVPGYNAYSAQFQTQRNLGVLCRNSHGKLADITATLTTSGS